MFTEKQIQEVLVSMTDKHTLAALGIIQLVEAQDEKTQRQVEFFFYQKRKFKEITDELLKDYERDKEQE